MKLNHNYGVAIKKVPFFLKLNFMLFSSYERQKFFCFEELKSKKNYMIILKLLHRASILDNVFRCKTAIAGLPGGSVVNTLHFEGRVRGFNSWSETKDPYAMG